MTGDRPVALVLGASADAPPPGIEAADDVLELRYAPDAGPLDAALPGAQALFFWHGEREELEMRVAGRAAICDGSRRPRLGSTDSCSRRLVDSDVAVTNARGVFDEPIAEWVIGAMLAFATGLHRSIVDQQAGVWGHDRSTERLEGRHLTVVGPGPIGRATASRALALGMTVTLVGRSARDDEVFGTVIGPRASPRRSAPPTTCSTPCRSRRTTPSCSMRPPSRRCDRPPGSSTWVAARPSTSPR